MSSQDKTLKIVIATKFLCQDEWCFARSAYIEGIRHEINAADNLQT